MTRWAWSWNGVMALSLAAAGPDEEARAEILRMQKLEEGRRYGTGMYLMEVDPIALAVDRQARHEDAAGKTISALGPGAERLEVARADGQAGPRPAGTAAPDGHASHIIDWYERADWAAYYHEPQLALDAMEKMRGFEQGRGLTLMPLLWQPLMRDVRKLPGFKDLVTELKLVDYWREYGWGEHCKPAGETDFSCS